MAQKCMATVNHNMRTPGEAQASWKGGPSHAAGAERHTTQDPCSHMSHVKRARDICHPAHLRVNRLDPAAEATGWLVRQTSSSFTCFVPPGRVSLAHL